VPNDNIRNAADLFISGLNTAAKLTVFSNFVDTIVTARLVHAKDIIPRDECRDGVYEDIQMIAEDRRGIDRANDFQNYEEAYARGEI